MNSYIQKITKNIIALMDAKNKDYGNSYDKLRAEYDDSFAIRVKDKLNRYENLIGTELDSQISESLEDTLSDIIGYTLLELNYMHSNASLDSKIKYWKNDNSDFGNRRFRTESEWEEICLPVSTNVGYKELKLNGAKLDPDYFVWMPIKNVKNEVLVKLHSEGYLI